MDKAENGINPFSPPSNAFAALVSQLIITEHLSQNTRQEPGWRERHEEEKALDILAVLDPSTCNLLFQTGLQLMGSRLMGSQLLGSQLMGSQLLGSRLMGSQLLGSPLIGHRQMGPQLMTLRVRKPQSDESSTLSISQIAAFSLPRNIIGN